MRTAARHFRGVLRRRPNNHLSFTKFNRKLGKMYSHSVRNVKNRPLAALGVALSLAAASGLMVWMKLKK